MGKHKMSDYIKVIDILKVFESILESDCPSSYGLKELFNEDIQSLCSGLDNGECKKCWKEALTEISVKFFDVDARIKKEKDNGE